MTVVGLYFNIIFKSFTPIVSHSFHFFRTFLYVFAIKFCFLAVFADLISIELFIFPRIILYITAPAFWWGVFTVFSSVISFFACFADLIYVVPLLSTLVNLHRSPLHLLVSFFLLLIFHFFGCFTFFSCFNFFVEKKQYFLPFNF